MQRKTNMEQHKYIIASDRDILGTWTESNIIEVQSLPDAGNGLRGIAVQGVGATKQPRNAKKTTTTTTLLTEQQRQQQQHFPQTTTVVTSAPGPSTPSTSSSSSSVLAFKPANSSEEIDGRYLMINTLKPAMTKLGKQRIRMKWSTEVNEFILRTYYHITNLETQCKHYRDTLHRLFSEEFPDVEVCAQRIADQRRAIVKNHLLPQERIDEIRREVELELEGGETAAAVASVTSSAAASSSVGVVETSVVTAAVPIMVTTPHLMTISKGGHNQPVTVWYGCVKEEQHDEGYAGTTATTTVSVTSGGAGPTSHKLRKLNHEGASSIGGGQSQQPNHHQQQQQQQTQQAVPQHIIIHTTGSLGLGPHTVTTTANALRR